MVQEAVRTQEGKPPPLRVLILEDNPADAELVVQNQVLVGGERQQRDTVSNSVLQPRGQLG